jgi:hypothetical protein
MTGWNWNDGSFIVAAASLVATLLIPLILAVWAARDARHMQALHALQAESLAAQLRIHRRVRRDGMLRDLEAVADATHLELLWGEIDEYSGADGRLLRTAFRSNPSVRLPGGRSSGVLVDDMLDTQGFSDYVRGLERRYAAGPSFPPFLGLTAFLELARLDRLDFPASDVDIVTDVVTGPCALFQRPGHGFYRELVNRVPVLAGGLLSRVERISPQAGGGLRLNVLTGVLVAIDDAELGRGAPVGDADLRRLRESVVHPIAHLLHRDVLRSFDRWNLDGSTEPVTATVAWLIRVVGCLADEDDHLAMRMIENLAAAIRSIPEADAHYGWGVDRPVVRDGFLAIRRKEPALWARHGDALEAAADAIGDWRLRPAA